MTLIEDENDKMKFKVNFYTIFLCFNYFFKKEAFMSLLNEEQKRERGSKRKTKQGSLQNVHRKKRKN